MARYEWSLDCPQYESGCLAIVIHIDKVTFSEKLSK